MTACDCGWTVAECDAQRDANGSLEGHMARVELREQADLERWRAPAWFGERLTAETVHGALCLAMPRSQAPALETIGRWTNAELAAAVAWVEQTWGKSDVEREAARPSFVLRPAQPVTADNFHARVDHDEQMAGENFIDRHNDHRWDQ